jgi:hypothetical protein
MSGPGQPYEYPGQNPFSPVDPYTPVNYPEYPPSYPPPSPPPPPPPPPPGYGYPPSYHGAPPGYQASPAYTGGYDPYQAGYGSTGTNGLAIASLVVSILGLLVSLFCWVGGLIPAVGLVLGIVGLNQVNRTKQPGRGLAIAGIAVGGVGIAVAVVGFIILVAIATHTH